MGHCDHSDYFQSPYFDQMNAHSTRSAKYDVARISKLRSPFDYFTFKLNS